jgi:RNA polymerase sigma-70 factor (sigma-E family)
VSSDFDEFVVSRGPVLLRFAQVLSGDPYLAEDLVQEVLARSHRRWDRIARMDSPEAYIRKAVLREYLSWRRRKASTEKVVHEVTDRASGHDLEHQVVSRDQLGQLLAGLPRTQRAVLVLRFYYDLPDSEIAERLGWAQPTVRSTASRALAKLRTAGGLPTDSGVRHG